MNILKRISLVLLLHIFSVSVICEVQLRHATIDDLQDLLSVHYHSFHATYDHVLPNAYTTKKSAEYLQKYWLKFFNKDDNRCAFIALDEGRAVGIITAGPIKFVEQEIAWWPCTGYDCEIYKLYVLPESQGRGIGKLLIKSAFESLYACGYQKAIVRVFAQNTNAIGFMLIVQGCRYIQTQSPIGLNYRIMCMDFQ